MSQERVSRSASFAFISKMVGALLTAILTIFLGRALTETQYGNLTFALGVVALATLFADLGIATSSGRYMAERRDDPVAAARVFRTSWHLKLWVALAASVALFAFAGPICDAFGSSGAAWPLRVLSVSLLAQSMFALFLGSFIAIGKLKATVLLATVESVAEVLASVLLVVLGAAATGAALGNSIGYTVGVVVGVVVVKRQIGSFRESEQEKALPSPSLIVSPRQILSYARPLLLVDTAFRVFSSIDVLLIAAIIGGGPPVAAFGISMRLGSFLDYPAAAVGAAISPRLALRNERESSLKLLSESLRYLLIMQMLFTAPLIIWSEAIMNVIFGNKYPEASEVLQALAPFVYLSGIAQITTLAVNYIGEARRRVPIAIAMLTTNIVIDVVLLPKIGIVAGAIGTSAAYAVWVPPHLWLLRDHIGLRLRPLAVTGLRTCIAGAAMVGALAALGTGKVAWPLMLAGVIVGPAAYLAVLFATREVSLGDVTILRRMIASR
jgi:O-antigen/teichoic acid export membrane protein